MIWVFASGIYLILVAKNNNVSQFESFILSQKGFVPWIIAIGIFYGMYQVPELKKVVAPFAGITFIALLIHSANTGALQGEISSLEQMIGIGQSIP